jgi:hypothetical protein
LDTTEGILIFLCIKFIYKLLLTIIVFRS